MANTHYFLIAGDQWRGRPLADGTQVDPNPGAHDPLYGQLMTLLAAPSIEVVPNTYFSCGTSLARGRVLKKVTDTTYIVESWDHPSIGVPGAAFAPSETVTFERADGTSGTGSITIAASGLDYPLYGQPGLRRQDAVLNSFIPEDKSDTPFYDRQAKPARSITLDGATVGAGEEFFQGDRCTTSGGASFRILVGNELGSDVLYIIDVTGTLSDSDVVTNQRNVSWQATIDTVGDETTAGTWVAHHHVPNLNGTSNGLWENPPNGNGTDGQAAHLGMELQLLRGAYEHFVQEADVANRGVRLIPFEPRDVQDEGGDVLLGGVSVQCIKCDDDPFPETWTIGETVTAGSWSATLHHFNAAQGFLYVVDTNDEVLVPGTITGGTSATTANATTACLGWQKGSLWYQSLLAEITVAQAKSNSLWQSQPAQWEGALLAIWDAEVMTFVNFHGCPWRSFSETINAWKKFLTDLRTDLGQDDMQIALWHGDPISRANAANVNGYPYAQNLRAVMENLQTTVPGVRLVRTEDFEPAQTTGLPKVSEMVVHRPQDYIDAGFQAWRLLQLKLITPSGGWKICPLIFVGGQSQQVGDISSALLLYDRDPDLYPSAASFPGGSTVDPKVITFNTVTRDWEPLDIGVNANHFYGMSSNTFGPPVSLMARMKGRFADEGEYSGIVGLINLPVNATSVSREAIPGVAQFGAGVTWDVSPNNITVTQSMTVTVQAASGLIPARGRFTATAGAFSTWEVNAPVFVENSVLGLQGAGGNNSAQYSGNLVYDVAEDGSWVELTGTFVAEGPLTFKLTWGLRPLIHLVREHIQEAFEKLAPLKLIPWPVLKVWEQGESDLGLDPDDFEAKTLEVLNAIDDEFSIRAKGQDAVAEVIVQLSSKTPIGTDENLTAFRAKQADIAAARPNAALVDPSSLPMEFNGLHTQRASRFENGIHRTARGHITAGFLIDQAAGTLSGIPAHPQGDVAIDAGAIDGGENILGADGDFGTDEIGTDAPPPTLIVEDGTGKADAESLVDITFADAYWNRFGDPTFWTEKTQDEKEIALREATRDWVQAQVAPLLRGVPQHLGQRLCYPRYGCHDDWGRLVDQSTVPDFIKEATCLIAGDILQGDDVLPNEVNRGSVTRETRKGAGFEKTTEYANGGGGSMTKRRAKAEGLVYPWLAGGEGSGVSRS